MWKRKVIKKKAMALMKQGYFRILPVCFLIAMLTTAYSFSTTFLNLQISSGSLGNDAAYVSGIPNSEAILDIAVHLLEGTPLSGALNGILYDSLSMIIDLFSTNISVFFSFIRTANYFLTGVSVGRFSPFRVGLKTPISVNLKSPMHHVCY